MRIIPFIIGTVITIALVILLDNKWGAIPPVGKFLSPQQGFWQNAEAVDANFNEDLRFDNLKGKTTVYLDERLVPHVFAEQDEDAYFVQGFLHAKFRLWQMEFQTHAAAGRVSEILGSDDRFLRYDREQRRLGMVYGAERAVEEINKDATTKTAVDAYTAGVNAYIQTLTESSLPLEYKLLDYKPEQWSPLKCGLFLKMMTKDLAGFERDLEFTNAKSVFSTDELEALYPQLSDSTYPVIPAETIFLQPGIIPQKPITADSLYFKHDTTVQALETTKPDRTNGSNNWAVSGQKTKSGAPILCNDPHLNLSLPSIWYEMQLHTPTMNAYGATFPGSPAIIIGFNDSIAFGFTNAMRDVKDYYQIRFQDGSKNAYWFDSAWKPAQLRIEEIKVRGAATVLDTVAYTVFGPVMYDEGFTPGDNNHTALAVRWTAHDPSNETLMWLKLNRAKNYDDYLEAIKTFSAPGQNMLFASKSGDIALWQQARFPAQWKGQGLYVMPGQDSSYMWQGFIPQEENPHIINPASGFIQSANQRPVDSSYAYFIPGNYISARGVRINRELERMQNITPQDMMALQNDIYDPFAAAAVPLLLRHVNENDLSNEGRSYINSLQQWDFNATAIGIEASIFRRWWDTLYQQVWQDEFARLNEPKDLPDNQTLLEALLKNENFKYVDDINTTENETLTQQVTKALEKTINALQKVDSEDRQWWKQKNTTIRHLLRTVTPFSRPGLNVGGWRTTVNAISGTHGPSWRMIVHLTTPTEAYGIYPGGESGNPGSPFYDSFVDTWTQGKYYRLWMMQETEKEDKRIRGIITFSHT